MAELSTYCRNNPIDGTRTSPGMIENLESRLFFSAGSGVTPGLKSAAAPPVTASLHAAAAPQTPQTSQAPTAAAAASASGPVTGTPLGGNLSKQMAVTPEHAYVDLIKASVIKNPTGGAVAKDARGWPLADFAVLTWDGGYGGVPVDPGVYHLSFNGPASTKIGTYLAVAGQPVVSIVKTGFNPATQLNTYNVTVPKGVTKLGFTFTRTAGQVKNLKVIQPGYNPASYPVFTNKYINLLTSLHPFDLRTMDFTATNDNPVANWGDRSTPGDASYVLKGAPWEYVIQIVNQIHTNVWINVPFHATDDYVKQLATLFKNTLAPNLVVYLEFSNEVWNDALEQGASNLRAALAEVQAGAKSGHPSDLNYDHQPVNLKQTDPNTQQVVNWADRRTARRLLQISNIFKSVWTGAGRPNPIGTAVRPILGGQGPILSRFSNMLTYISKVYGAPKTFFYGIGIAPYWGLNLYQDQQGADGQYKTLNPNLTVAQVLDGMNRSISHYESQRVFANTLPYGSMYGLKLEAYEGGVDTHGPFNIAAKRAASLDLAIKALMGRYLRAWYSQGGDVLDWYRLGAQDYNIAGGTFAISDDINNLNEPKEQEFRTIRGVS